MQETFNKVELDKATDLGSFNEARGALGEFALKNAQEMQAWQDKFCEMSGIYAMCLDAKGVALSEFSGNPHEIDIIRKYVTDIRIHNIYKRVSESELEDQAVEITEIPNLRLAAVAVKSGKETAAVWIVCGVFTDAEYEAELYHYNRQVVLRLLNDI